ncbi:MAG TPA: DUF1800 domain-containing protein [Candidatus Saccharimonadales bacterium]|nr:DUF1800 domain-containing protein [Candidatus Saccharimonadales bacterium]
MDADLPLVAHLLRRTSFGPFPGQVRALSASGVAVAVATVLSATPSPLPAPPDLSLKNNNAPVAWWLTRMADPGAGLVEKMTWFWHGHLTSSRSKVNDWGLMWQQHLLLRANALGNFRDLMQAITIDPAMLWYLDGNASSDAAPNENYARELMELFTLGHGNYTQADVTAGAHALSGWRIDRRAGGARFVPADGPTGPVTYLGQSASSASDVINAVCDQPACAPFIAGEIYAYLAGVPPTPAQADQLATVFRGANLEIKPLVAAILTDPGFPTLRQNRGRYPVEWITAAMAAMGLSNPKAAESLAVDMGQIPFHPPAVNGWPPGMRWLAPSFALARDALAAHTPAIDEVAGTEDPVSAAFERCSLYEVTAETRNAIEQAAASVSEPRRKAATILGLAIASPEFALA